ncbi:SDR family NAD(P)-dependent oxidoreductase [Nonomuraea sp. NPDC050202]|uniref:SDR family NAD(P)-dependent oxidoreductase n=1 Tax=Nonomuraea sp. NPDC050202 TaxID=3155035 RepID=UPI0033F30E15
MPPAPWDVRRLPRAEGRNVLVTGGNAGIGYFVAEQLAGTGATVVLACRDPAKAEAARASIRARVPGANVRHLRLDLAHLPSVEASAGALGLDRLDAVVCNAGVLLDRRLSAAGSTTLSVVVHPGGALDSLTPSRPPVHLRTTGERLRGLPAGLLLQGKEAAAWPAVRAVLDPSVRGGQLWGPRVFGIRGLPVLERVQGHLADTVLAARLWTATAGLTGLDPSSNLG